MDKLSGAERTDYNYKGLNWLSDNFAPFVFANNVSNAVKLPIADTAHCSYKNEYTELLTMSIAAFLKHTGNAPGQIKVGSGGSVSRADWIDWTAPTLP